MRKTTASISKEATLATSCCPNAMCPKVPKWATFSMSSSILTRKNASSPPPNTPSSKWGSSLISNAHGHPFREQKVRMQRGKRYQVYCYIDDKTYRIVCSSKIEKFQKAISEKQNPNPTADHTPHGNSQLSTVNSQLSTPDRRVLIGDFSTRLFEHLKLSEKGFTPYHDKSPAEEIYAMFGVSKKVFKQAVGDLLKRELIQIKPDGIELTIKGKATGVEE